MVEKVVAEVVELNAEQEAHEATWAKRDTQLSEANSALRDPVIQLPDDPKTCQALLELVQSASTAAKDQVKVAAERLKSKYLSSLLNFLMVSISL